MSNKPEPRGAGRRIERRVDHPRRRDPFHSSDPDVDGGGHDDCVTALTEGSAVPPCPHELEVTLGWEPQFRWRVSRDGLQALGAAGVPDDQTAWHHPISARLRALLAAAEQQPEDQFVVVARAGAHFMQCLWRPMGWRLEKREGDEDHHYVASVHQPDRFQDDTPDIVQRILAQPIPVMSYLDLDQVSEAMGSYLLADPEPDWLAWGKIMV